MTAVLENVNPYSKYGLTRKPTYEEIIGLIGENEKTHWKTSRSKSYTI